MHVCRLRIYVTNISSHHIQTVIVVCKRRWVIFVCLTNKRQELFATSINQYIDAKYNTCFKQCLQFAKKADSIKGPLRVVVAIGPVYILAKVSENALQRFSYVFMRTTRLGTQ